MPPTHPSQADVAAAYRTLIAHETEPKEQDFYRTRLQRLEPTTEPECEFDCRSRVAAAGVGVYCPQCSAKSADTDLTTQLAIQQIEGEAAWWRSIDFDRNASRTFESMTGDSQQAVRTGVERVLAHLTAAGRLIPAGGMALTAEQVENVRAAREELRGYRNYTGHGRSHVNQLIAAVDALFPATEPAEPAASEGVNCGANSVVLGWCTLSAQHEGLHTNGTYFWGQAPAPAEPAEEETKAEGHDPDALAKRLAWIWHDGWDACGERERGYLRRAAEMAHSHYASSPVVPAPTEASVIGGAAVALRSAMALLDPHEGGDWEHAWRTIGDLADCASRAYAAAPTETGPWPSLLAVPVTVQKVKDAKGYEWHRRGSTDGWRGCNGADAYTSNCRTGHRDSAPFVAAEEG